MDAPVYLKNGDSIGITATARKVSLAELQPAINYLENKGFKVVLAPHIFESHFQFGGTDEQRIADLQHFLDDPSIKAVLCARGGYGTVRLIDELNFDKFVKSPKWIIGYSDITVIHSHLQQNLQIESLHAAMTLDFPKIGEENLNAASIFSAITGVPIEIKAENHPLNRQGITTAEIVGGNLSILYSLTGTKTSLNTAGKILFLEDLDEYLYHVDRMMMNLKRAGMLSDLKGLVIGGMTSMNDNAIPYGKTAEEIIKEAVGEYNYPVCFNVPAGHINQQNALILGRTVKLDVNLTGASLNFLENN